MRKIILSALLIALAFGFFRTTYAHEYKTDGTITVLLHTNPDDDPVAAEPASLFFQVADSTDRFDAANCDCSVTISDQGKKLFAGSLLRIGGASIYEYTVPFTFPKKAVYSISVTGKPKTAGAFGGFQVQFNLRVDRGAPSQPKKIPMAAVIAVVVIIAGIGLYSKRKK